MRFLFPFNEISSFLETLSPIEIYRIYFKTQDFIYWWPGELTTGWLLNFKESLPLFEKILDINTFNKIAIPGQIQFLHGDDFKKSKEVFPELHELLNATKNFIISANWSPEMKSDSLLKAIGCDPNDEGDYEACIYTASRGNRRCIDTKELSETWKTWIMEDIKREKFPISINIIPKKPKNLRKRAKDGSLTLAEAASIFTKFDNTLGRFWDGRDDQEEFIDVTMLRMVEWFEIGGFDPWWNSIVSEIQRSISDDGEPWLLSRWLFIWCRSDLALQIIDRTCIETYLWILMNSGIEKKFPWRILFFSEKQKPKIVDNLQIAANILFVLERVKPNLMSDSIRNEAINILMNTQLASGGWPTWINSAVASIETTATAIHALCLAKPRGFLNVAQKGADWLRKQQDEIGLFNPPGFDPVFLTVLVMDALTIAAGDTNLTFRIGQQIFTENIVENTITNIMPPIKRRFTVALSFPGEKRSFVDKVAEGLANCFGGKKVFYDKFYEAELARPNLDIYLQKIYHDDSELIVVFLCDDYEKKEWCGLEWRAIRDLIKKRRADDIMPLRFDKTEIAGLFSVDGYLDISNRKPEEVVEHIFKRVEINRNQMDN